MSKGHGSVQRAILAHLESRPRTHLRETGRGWETRAYPFWEPIEDVAGTIFCPDDRWAKPTRSQMESTRRAAKQLAAEGLAEICYRAWPTVRNDPRAGRIEADIPRLSIRPVLTEAERKAERVAIWGARRRAAGILAGARQPR